MQFTVANLSHRIAMLRTLYLTFLSKKHTLNRVSIYIIMCETIHVLSPGTSSATASVSHAQANRFDPPGRHPEINYECLGGFSLKQRDIKIIRGWTRKNLQIDLFAE